MKIKIKRLSEYAILPKYAKKGDAGLDFTCTKKVWNNEKEYWVMHTGWSIEIPPEHVGLIFPRSSVRDRPLFLANSVGILDSSYTGELIATFKVHHNKEGNVYDEGERIIQLMVLPYPYIEVEEVDELSITERGEGGHGSSGK